VVHFFQIFVFCLFFDSGEFVLIPLVLITALLSPSFLHFVQSIFISPTHSLSLSLCGVHQGPSIYYMGIIDLVQPWTMQKRFERFTKGVLYRQDFSGISAQPPNDYSDRFIEAVKGKICVSTPLPI
jgi:hypothetical protein